MRCTRRPKKTWPQCDDQCHDCFNRPPLGRGHWQMHHSDACGQARWTETLTRGFTTFARGAPDWFGSQARIDAMNDYRYGGGN